MKKIYTCKNCKKQTEIYDRFTSSNILLFHCPKCFTKSENTSIEDWAEISWISFDEDIETSILDGTFDQTFGELSTKATKRLGW